MAILAILGASGHGKVIADIALSSGEWTDIVFFDDAYPAVNKIEVWPVSGTSLELKAHHLEFDGVIVAIGDNQTRLLLQDQLYDYGCKIATLIHPNASVSQFATINSGSVIMPGAVVNAFSHVGLACIVNSNAVIEHDCYLESGVHISPNAALAGSVKIGCCSWIGIGSNIKQSVTIVGSVIIGAGSLVINDIHISGTYIGAPASLLS
jgi:sugar O-acyltransferase (sialic acid O-acetyltransferase NeuD family)